MKFKNILYTKNESKTIARITINRPEVRNALDQATKMELMEVLEDLKKEKNIRVVVITGAGNKSFVAGADIKELIGVTPQIMEERVSITGAQLIENFPMPVIAMINGHCFGGGNELAMACDIRISSENAKFGQPEINIGIIPGAGGTQRLPRLIGWGKAKELIFTGRIIDAIEAEKFGLVDKVVPEAELEKTVNDLCETIAKKSPLLLRLAKKSINTGLYYGFAAGMQYEKSMVSLCFSTEDQKEGMTAFLEKREPVFMGR